MGIDEGRHGRRSDDSSMKRAVAVAERIILWATVLGLVATVATAYVRVKDVVSDFPGVCAKVTVLETRRSVDDERWTRLEKWMERIDRRLDRAR